ncbi:hypothetical protein DSO57_1020160 [Entomophthora muscae]|uniref:Uncharacterized protein n=1 Tax=Entomophthora muscae TaxID=34485 RepID=A0ACC2RII8_9FUNG|nr:hypothetical protein DSO57_1020160 [Entomophthora muscae]
MVTSVNIASPQEVAKIYKLSIATQHSNPEKQPISTLPWSATILSDLIGKHRYRSASRFVLNIWESNLPTVLLMVVNWDNYYWKHQSSEDQAFQPRQLSHSVYIKYLEVSKSTERNLVESWTLDDSVIGLSYPKAYITEVLANIVNFENLLPSPFKTDLFKNGYIAIPETQP